jgi:hypothetical protein
VSPLPGAQPPMPAISEHFTTIVQLNGRDAVALIDCGATENMLSPLFANLAEIKTDRDKPKVSITIADGTTRTCAGTAMAVPLRMGKLSKTLKVTEDFFVPEMALPSGFDIILGLP